MLTAQELRRTLAYDPETGVFTRRIGRAAGKSTTGSNSNGYRTIGVNGRNYYAHRLAWLYMTGEWPKHEIDHINMKKNDNRWANLRESTVSQNRCNTRGQIRRKLYAKGVSMSHNKGKPYKAVISVDKRYIHLGYFRTIDEAAQAYAEAAKLHHGEFARTTRKEK